MAKIKVAPIKRINHPLSRAVWSPPPYSSTPTFFFWGHLILPELTALLSSICLLEAHTTIAGTTCKDPCCRWLSDPIFSVGSTSSLSHLKRVTAYALCEQLQSQEYAADWSTDRKRAQLFMEYCVGIHLPSGFSSEIRAIKAFQDLAWYSYCIHCWMKRGFSE